MARFSDLNLNITNLPKKSIDELVEYSIKLGYDNLALTFNYEFPTINSSQGASKKASNTRTQLPMANKYELPEQLATTLKNYGRQINIYSRINVIIKQSDLSTHLQHLRSKQAQSYDLVSLEPVDNQVLLYLCKNNFNADIISCNSAIECGLTDKHLIRSIMNAISSYSLCFEINYHCALTSSIERRDFLMLARCLAFNTKLKGLIMSSGASNKLNLRGPYELLSLAKLFDISERDAHKLVRHCSNSILMNSFCRKHTETGMVYFNDTKSMKKLEEALIVLKRKELAEANDSKTSKQTRTS